MVISIENRKIALGQLEVALLNRYTREDALHDWKIWTIRASGLFNKSSLSNSGKPMCTIILVLALFFILLGDVQGRAKEHILVRVLISGCQIGSDQAGMRAAQDADPPILTTGFSPPGQQCLDGKIPERYPNQPTGKEHSSLPGGDKVPRSLRTEWNAKTADATLIFRSDDEPQINDIGTDFTTLACKQYKRPYLELTFTNEQHFDQDVKTVALFLSKHKVVILNCAGPARAPKTASRIYRLLSRVFAIRTN